MSVCVRVCVCVCVRVCDCVYVCNSVSLALSVVFPFLRHTHSLSLSRFLSLSVSCISPFFSLSLDYLLLLIYKSLAIVQVDLWLTDSKAGIMDNNTLLLVSTHIHTNYAHARNQILCECHLYMFVWS